MSVIEIRLFAVLRDRFGAETLPFELSANTTAAGLIQKLSELYPKHSGHLAVCRVAVNHQFASADRPLTAADEVALIPPVSGG